MFVLDKAILKVLLVATYIQNHFCIEYLNSIYRRMYFGQEYLGASIECSTCSILDTEFPSTYRVRSTQVYQISNYVLECIMYLRAAFFQNPDRVFEDDVFDSAYTAFSIRWLAVQNAGHPGAETEIW